MIHVVIPDCQVKPGVPTDHLRWIGNYIVDHFAGKKIRVINLGDFWDMPSLSSYDKGKKSMEGRRYKDDIEAGNRGVDILCEPLAKYNKGRRNKWHPDLHFLLGNHEARIEKACDFDAQLDGVISYEDFNLKKWGWKVHGFLEVVWLDGLAYSHYFYEQNSGRPLSGMAESRLKAVGHSFVQGHQQGLWIAQRSTIHGRQRALITGSCYLHSEKYRGPQAADEWRGILVLHQVENGNYDLMEVSLDYLCRRYEKKTLKQFMKGK